MTRFIGVKTRMTQDAIKFYCGKKGKTLRREEDGNVFEVSYDAESGVYVYAVAHSFGIKTRETGDLAWVFRLIWTHPLHEWDVL